MVAISYYRDFDPPVVMVTADDGTVTTWPLDEFEANPSACVPPPPPQVPAEIQMWQARAILFRAGLLGMVEQAVKAATNPEIEIAWEYAPNVVRRSAFVAAMAGALELTDEQIDALFIEGAKIK